MASSLRTSSKKRRPKTTGNTLTIKVENPLLIKLVITEVFKYLSFSDLKSCRVVHSLWKQEATTNLQKLCGPINFLNDDKVLQFAEFIKTFPRSAFLVTSVELHTIFERPSLFHKVLRLTCPYLVELKLVIEPLYKRFYNKLHKGVWFPKLKNLSITTTHYMTMYVGKDIIYQIFKQIVDCSPGLGKFACHATASEDSVYFLTCLESAPCINSISEIKISSSFGNKQLEKLIGMGVKLKTFVVDIPSRSGFKSDLIMKFLETQSVTLENLKVCQSSERNYLLDNDGDDVFSLKFPKMEKLNRIQISRKRIRPPIYIVVPTYINLPVLSSLSLDTLWCDDKYEDIFNNRASHKCKTLTELNLKFDHVSAEMMTKAVNIFPNVDKLEIPAKLEILKVVYELQPQLEELTLRVLSNDNEDQEYNYVDYMLIGKSAEETKEVRKSCGDDGQKMQEKLSLIDPVDISITCLQNLKILRWVRKDITKETKMFGVSEFGCLQLIKLQQLKRLEFYADPESRFWISSKMLPEMQKQFLVWEFGVE